MPYYCVQLDVNNLLVEMDGVTGKHGFITNQFVQADDADIAEQQAVQAVRDDDEIRALVKNDASDPPVIDVSEIIELQSLDGVNQSQGRIWYAVKSKRWWEFWKS